MALKALKCPNCDANIQVDDDRDYGICSYCGAQIQIKDVVEVRYVAANETDTGADFMKLLEDAQGYLKMKDYFRAEEGFMEMIRLYPGKAIGYERLICAITHDYTLFPFENSERLQILEKKMLAVAEEDEKSYYEEISRKVSQGFSRQISKQLPDDKTVQIAVLKDRVRNGIVGTVTLILISIAIQKPAETNLMFSVLGILLCIAAIGTGYVAIKSKIKLDQLLEEEDAE